MSTTVSYKGSTLVTADNNTVTLETAGTYLEDDIILTDSTTVSLQSKSVSYTPSESSQSATVTADLGYDGLSSVGVMVSAISTSYVGSGIARRDASDLVVNEEAVVVPAGYYADEELATVGSGSATPAASISASGATLTTGANTLTLSKSVSNTPQVSEGYIRNGTAGNSAVSLTASVTTRAANDFYPSLSSQTIPSGQYLTGEQTIHPVEISSNLIASNVKSGVTVTIGDDEDPSSLLSVTGTYNGSGATNFVTGTFTTSSTAGSVQTVSIPYTGSGYPIACMVYITGGAYNSAVSGWYNSMQRYAVGQWTMHKSVMTSSPTYTTSGTANYGVTTAIYKNSTSSSTSYTRTSGMNTNVFSSSNAANAALTCVRFKSATSMSVYVASTSYGLLANTSYTYQIIYSS